MNAGLRFVCVASCLVLAATAGRAADKVRPAVADALSPAPAGQVRFSGPLGQSLETCRQGRMLGQKISDLVVPFAQRREDRFWQTEFWGKWFTSAALAYRYQPDAPLRAARPGGGRPAENANARRLYRQLRAGLRDQGLGHLGPQVRAAGIAGLLRPDGRPPGARGGGPRGRLHAGPVGAGQDRHRRLRHVDRHGGQQHPRADGAALPPHRRAAVPGFRQLHRRASGRRHGGPTWSARPWPARRSTTCFPAPTRSSRATCPAARRRPTR